MNEILIDLKKIYLKNDLLQSRPVLIKFELQNSARMLSDMIALNIVIKFNQL